MLQHSVMKVWVIAIILSFTICHSLAQNSNYRFENITHEDGLADRHINAIIQDSRGLMWFGSNDGLTSYDGYSCKIYRHKFNDGNSISDNEINAFCLDQFDKLWIGTKKGLNCFNQKNNSFQVFMKEEYNSISGNEITAIVKDKSGNLWITSRDGGLDRMTEKVNEKSGQLFYEFKPFLQNPAGELKAGRQLLSICFDKYNRGWIGTDSGLILLNPTTEKTYKFFHSEKNENSIGNNIVNRVYEDKKGNIWISGNNMLDRVTLVYKQNTPGLIVKHFLPSITQSNTETHWIVNDFLVDKNGNGWMATNDKGILKFHLDSLNNSESIEQFLHEKESENSLTSSNVYSLFEGDGIIWAGTLNGVSKYIFSRQRFNQLQYLNKKVSASGFIISLLEENDNLWIGTDADTLSVITLHQKNHAVNYILLSPWVKGDQVNNLFMNSKGDIFIGTLLNGFFVIPAKSKNYPKYQLIHFTTKKYPGLSSNNIYSFAEEQDGSIWIGTYTGLCKFNLDTKMIISVYVSPNKKVTSGYIMRKLLLVDDKELWCGTDDGIKVFKGGKIIKNFKHNDLDESSLSSNRIRCMLMDASKNIWVGTSDGLNLFSRLKNNFKRITLKSNSGSNDIKSIESDEKGNLWIATNYGLLKYEPKRNYFWSFGISDGLTSDQFIANSSYRAKNGMIYFGTNKGIVSFHPENIKPNPFIPPVVITKIKILDKDIFSLADSKLLAIYLQDNRIQLKHNQNFFSFEFAGLNYSNPLQIKYAYILEGIDPGWNYSGNERFARYADVRPGKYKFKVKAANNDGVWNNSPAVIDIVITSPWWQTWWFYLGCTVFVSSILYAGYRLRLKQIIKFYNLRSSIARDLHDDVGSALSSIALLSSIAQNGKAKSTLQPKEVFSRIGDTSKRMIDLLDDIVWSVNPENDRFNNILIRMREYAAEMLEAKNINFSFKTDEKVETVKIAMQTRKDYFLVFKEAINNLAKYSGASNAEIAIVLEKGNILTTIQDDGKGFDLTCKSSGNGLKNMNYRTAGLKGNLTINSVEGKGTTIILKIPVT